MSKTIAQESIFETDKAELTLCNDSDRVVLHFAEYHLDFRLCELHSFRKKILGIDLTSMLDANSPDIEIIYVGSSDSFVIVDIKDVLELRELFAGALTMMELNTVLHKSLYRNPFQV